METYKYNYILWLSTLLVKKFRISSSVALWIACQSALETDFGTSRIYKDLNNLFGMKNPIHRISLAISDNCGFASYLCREDSVTDYLLRNLYFGFPSDSWFVLDCYKKYIRLTNYCPERGYISRVDSIYKLFKNFKNVNENTKS